MGLVERPEYCSRMEFEPGCLECSLVNYKRDCMNNPLKLLKCPKCGSDDVVKDGSKIEKGGRVQAVRCGECGYRGVRERFS